jgi:fructokinase
VVTEGEADYGKILPTPKPGWEGGDVLGYLSEHFPGVALAFDTDVNAAAIGEGFLGVAKGLKNFIYVTVGTGIGGGVVVNGRTLKSQPHAEVGHMLVPVLDDYPGCCSFHGNCLEGVASGTAIGKRWGVSPRELPEDHEAWDLEASYLAMMVQNLMACYAPEKIILGGGVMEQKFLLSKVREKFRELAGGYWRENDALLVPPTMGNQAGITGALVMAQQRMRGLS